MAEVTAKDILFDVRKALASSSVFALREIHVESVGDALFLSGQVSSFYHKQLAQELVRALAQGIEVMNSIRVCQEE